MTNYFYLMFFIANIGINEFRLLYLLYSCNFRLYSVSVTWDLHLKLVTNGNRRLKRICLLSIESWILKCEQCERSNWIFDSLATWFAYLFLLKSEDIFLDKYDNNRTQTVVSGSKRPIVTSIRMGTLPLTVSLGSFIKWECQIHYLNDIISTEI